MRRRLVLLSAAITTMVVIAFVVPLAALVRDLAADRATAPAQLRAQALAPVVGLADEETVVAAVDATRQSVSGAVHVVTPRGVVLGDGPFPGVPIDQAGVYELSDGSRAAVVPVVGEDSSGVVVIEIERDDLRQGVAAAWTILTLLGIALVVSAAWLTDRLARTSTRALSDVEATARQLSLGDLTARSHVNDPVEVQRIGLALNDLAERTTQLLTTERERAADLSHALRTPLTALRLDVEALDASVVRERVVDDLAALELAVDQAIHEARRPVREGAGARCDLAEIVRDRLDWWEPLAQEEGRAIRRQVTGGQAWVRGAASDFSQVVDALVGNVFAHTPPGTAMAVGLVVVDGRVDLVVQDDGPGFPEGIEVLARGVSGGDSTGLGLAIVEATVAAAGGAVEVVAPSATVRIDLPAVAGPR